VPAAASMLFGCAPRGPTWAQRTADQNLRFQSDSNPEHEIVYRDTGPGELDDQPAVIFIAGLGGSKAVWRDILPELPNVRCITLDLLGHGDSSAPATFDYRMDSQAEVVHNLIESLGLQRVVVVGASYGGGVAIELVRILSEQSKPAVAGIVLLGAAALDFPPPDSVKYARSRILRWGAMNLMSAEALVDILLRRAFFRWERATPELRAEYRRTFADRAKRSAIATAGKAMFEELAERRDEQRRRYATITCPTLAIWGRHDRTVPIDVMHQLEKILPNMRSVVIEDCGHPPAEEQPAETARVLAEFLNGLR
jgi:pimeloyl-ACP methyl ester carboxylesterase